jgi:uncharacterized protein (TIGR01319 family)
MRWSAVSTVAEGVAAGLLDPALADAAAVRQADPSYLPTDEAGAADDHAIAAAAVTVALRRHAGRSQVVFSPEGRVVERSGKDLREVDLLVGSGGVLRHSGADAADVLTRHLRADPGAGWQLPEHPRTVVDRDYVLAPVGLLARDHPEAARSLARRLLGP